MLRRDAARRGGGLVVHRVYAVRGAAAHLGVPPERPARALEGHEVVGRRQVLPDVELRDPARAVAALAQDALRGFDQEALVAEVVHVVAVGAAALVLYEPAVAAEPALHELAPVMALQAEMVLRRGRVLEAEQLRLRRAVRVMAGDAGDAAGLRRRRLHPEPGGVRVEDPRAYSDRVPPVGRLAAGLDHRGMAGSAVGRPPAGVGRDLALRCDHGRDGRNRDRAYPGEDDLVLQEPRVRRVVRVVAAGAGKVHRMPAYRHAQPEGAHGSRREVRAVVSGRRAHDVVHAPAVPAVACPAYRVPGEPRPATRVAYHLRVPGAGRAVALNTVHLRTRCVVVMAVVL